MLTWQSKRYRKIQSDTAQTNLLSIPFDANSWCLWYNVYMKERNFDAIRSMRIFISNSTIQLCEQGWYKTQKNGSVISIRDPNLLKQDAKDTIMYNSDTELVRIIQEMPLVPDDAPKSLICVMESDCIDAAKNLVDSGLNPVVLNMASYKRPGGGFRTGSGAQEENIFRRSNYYQILEDPDKKFDPQRKWKYPIPEFGGIYSPSVVIFRSNEDTGYALLENPFTLSFIAVSAYVRPQLQLLGKISSDKEVSNIKKKQRGDLSNKNQKQSTKVETFVMTEKFAEKTKRKIRVILASGLINGHHAIILSAFGCGAYQNPPNHMAQLFYQVINENEFKNRYKKIVFAIIDDHNSRKLHNPFGNIKPFEQAFTVLQHNETQDE
jgi:uncharacterized protein (TIGR02452 family)